MCVLPMAILQGNLPALNNVKIFLRGAVAQQVTEPEKFNLPTVKYVLSVSESSNSIQNYFLEAVTLWPRKGVLGLEQDRIHWAKTVRKQPVLLLTVGVGTADPPGGHWSRRVLDL